MIIRPTERGPRLQAAQHHVANKPFPVHVPGKHLWVVTGAWRIADPANPNLQLDLENLLNLAGPGCLWCEREYSPQLASMRCTGGPEVQS